MIGVHPVRLIESNPFWEHHAGIQVDVSGINTSYRICDDVSIGLYPYSHIDTELILPGWQLSAVDLAPRC